MRRLLLLVGLAGSLAGCQGLFAPSGCTHTITVTDSVKVFQGIDTTTHVDTLARLKLCAE